MANCGTHNVPSRLCQSRLTPIFGLVCLVLFNTSKSVWLWGTLGQERGGVLLTRHSARFGSGMPMVTLPCPPASSLCRLPVIHTDGNNFFPAPCRSGRGLQPIPPWGSFSLLLPLCSVLATEICSSYSPSPTAFLVPRLPLWTGVWPLKFLCFGVFSPLPRSVLVLPCDGMCL